jgi:CelD/BcsL family acetyltransferase involved in cellulose biosynthesis
MFVNGLLREFGTGDEHLCVLREGVTVAAMLILRRRNPFLWSSFAPSQCQLGPMMVPDAAMLGSLVTSLPGKVLMVDLLSIDGQLGGLLRDTQAPTRRTPHCLTMSIPLTGSFADYWTARPSGLSSNLRQYEKRLEQDALNARLVRLTSAEEVEAAVVRYAQLDGQGWKGRRGTAPGSTREQCHFYEQLFRDAAQRGAAVVYELWLGDRLAASRLALSEDRTLVMLETSYDEALASYAPERLLLRTMIEDAFITHAGGVIEFCTDASVDQLEWASASRWIEHMTLFRNRAAELAYHTLKAYRGPRRLQARRAEDQPRDRPTDSAVEVYAHPEELPADARRFLQDAEARNIGFGFHWYRNLVQTVYPDHKGLRLYALRRDGRLVALLPLRVERSRFGWRAHSLSNFYTTLYEPVLAPNVKGADLLPLLEQLSSDFRGVGSLMLSPMARGSHAYLVLMDALCLSRWFPFEFFAFGNWYEPVRQTWPEYLAARKSNVRSTIKRMGKKFATDGGVLEVVTRPEDMAEGIKAYEKVYAASWKQPEPFQGFMPGLIQTCAGKGILRLGVARLNGEPVAAQAWIVAHGRAEIYKVAYDEAFKQYSPGTLVTALLLEHVMEVDRVTEVDYLIGDDPYKKIWMSERRERWGIVAYNLSTVGGMSGFAREVLGRMAKHVRNVLRRPRVATEMAPTATKSSPATN